MHARPHERPVEVHAPYVAEMVRQEMIARYGGDVLTRGYHVTTTIDPVKQAAAEQAVRSGLLAYDHRHGWSKVEQSFELGADEDAATAAARLRGIPAQSGLLPAVVLRADSGTWRVTPLRFGASGEYRGDGEPLPFTLGVHGPLRLREGTWTLVPATVALRGGHDDVDGGIVPVLDARGRAALGRALLLENAASA